MSNHYVVHLYCMSTKLEKKNEKEDGGRKCELEGAQISPSPTLLYSRQRRKNCLPFWEDKSLLAFALLAARQRSLYLLALRMKSLKNPWQPGKEGGGQGPPLLWGAASRSCRRRNRPSLSAPSILNTSRASPKTVPPTPPGLWHIWGKRRREKNQ